MYKCFCFFCPLNNPISDFLDLVACQSFLLAPALLTPVFHNDYIHSDIRSFCFSNPMLDTICIVFFHYINITVYMIFHFVLFPLTLEAYIEVPLYI